jgi:membrane-bound metal-dependent hydrolase YbcI (DUF457 family)
MPSPIGHALAGVAVAWTADLIPGDRAWRTVPGTGTWHQSYQQWYQRAGGNLTLLCAGLGAAPDLDLAFAAHRTVTHSVGAVVFIGLFAAALAANARRPIARVTLMCAAAYGSHLLLDWLGADYYPPRGIQALWPINREWYISDTDVFRQTARLHLFTQPVILTNVRAIVQELSILLPVVALLWLVRVKALAGLAPEVAGRHHPAQ